MTTTTQILSLKTLLSPNKRVTLSFPGHSDFKIDLAFLSRETMVKIRKKATSQTLKKGALVENLDEDLFLELYAKEAIKGWKGLTMKILENFVPVAYEDASQELPYSEENALLLMKSSAEFDSFISEKVTEVSNFSTASGN